VDKLNHPVIFGKELLLRLRIPTSNCVCIELPAIPRETVKKFSAKFATSSVDDAIAKDQAKLDQGIERHKNYDKLIKLIIEWIKENLKTLKDHSTIGVIGLKFKDEKDRYNTRPMKKFRHSQELEDAFEEVVREWLEDKIVEPFNELDEYLTEEERKMATFNTNWFHIFSGKSRFVFNFKPTNDLLMDDTNDVPGIDEVFKKLGRSRAKIFSKLDLKSAYHQIVLRFAD